VIEVSCARCGVAVQDEHGQTALPLVSKVLPPPRVPASLRRLMARATIPSVGVGCVGFFVPQLGPQLLLVTVAAGLVLFAGLVLLQVMLDRAQVVAEGVAIEAERREARRKLDSLRDLQPLCAIAELPSDAVGRVRGRVKALATVRGDVVAELYESSWRRLGRFLVVDDSGEAEIDDDAVELWSEQAPGSAIVIHDGDWVEVVGRGRYHPVGQGSAGYRGGKELTRFSFEGEAERPLHLVQLK
jgi:hypothetical protein